MPSANFRLLEYIVSSHTKTTRLNGLGRHAKQKPSEQPRILKDGCIEIGDWHIKVNLSSKGTPSFFIRNTKKGENVSIDYKGETTLIKENGHEKVLVDKVPELEI